VESVSIAWVVVSEREDRGNLREASTLKNSPFFAGFTVDEVVKAKGFYGQTLGVFEVAELPGGRLSLRAANGHAVLIYPKPDHQPKAHTILNFPVDDIETAVDELRAGGVEFEQCEDGPI